MSPLLSVFVLAAALADPPATGTQPPANKPPTPAGDPTAAVKYVEPQFGTTAALSKDRGGVLATRIGVLPASKDINVATLLPAVWDVAIGNDHSKALKNCFDANMDDVQFSTPAIVVRCNCPALAAGTYNITLGIRKPDAAAPQKIALEIKRNATEIRTISAQSVDRVIAYPGAKAVVAPPEFIVVTATTGAPLTGVAIEQVDPVVSGNSSTTGKLNFSGPVDADTTGKASLPLSVTGDMPYGKSKTTVRVTAAELAGPVYVPVEIQTRFHPWLLLPAIFIGLLLGWLMRTVLKNVIERGGARLAVLDFVEKIDAAEATTTDATFVAEAQRISQVLQKTSGTAAEITAAVTKADGDLKSALDDLQQRLNAAAADVTARNQIVSDTSELPQSVAAILSAAAADLDTARAAVKSRDADAANAALTATSTELAKVVPATVAWIDLVVPAANDSAALKLPPEYDAPFKASIAKLKSQLDQIPRTGGAAAAADLVPKLRAAYMTVRHEIERQELSALLQVAAKVVTELKDNGKADPAPIESAATTLSDALDADVDATLGPVRDAGALLDVIKDVLSKAQPQNQPVAASLAAGDYVQAAVGLAGAILGGAPAPLTMFAPIPSVAVTAATMALAAPPVAQHTATAVPRQRTIRELFRAKALQFVMASIGIMLAGFLLLLPAFDGTWRGLLTALFWGYAGDISVDALTSAAQKFRT